MKVAIYNIETGRIRMVVAGPPSQIECQCKTGEEFYLNCPEAATHIINNEPVTIPVIPTTEELLTAIRRKRNQKLTDCDWTQLEDFPRGTQLKQQWKVYRHELRDFPTTCNPENPIWPTPPT